MLVSIQTFVVVYRPTTKYNSTKRIYLCMLAQKVNLRLLDTGRMDMQHCAHNRLKMYCEQLAKDYSTVYHFSHMI